MAEKHSRRKLMLGVCGCLLFVLASSVGLLFGDMSKGVAIFNMVFFGLCTLAWSYALFLKTGDAN
jgi:hypothetical protein